MRGSGGHERQAGFTLLELLIAVTLMVALFAMMAGSLGFGVTVWDRGESFATRSSELMIAQRFVRRQLGEALALTHPGDERRRVLAFQGRIDAVRFVTGSLAQAGDEGPFLVELRTARDGNGLEFWWRRIQPDLSDFDDNEEGESRVLMAGAVEAEFSYFGTNDQGDAMEWQSRWEQRAELPWLVRVRLRLAPESGRIWPELVVATGTYGVGPGVPPGDKRRSDAEPKAFDVVEISRLNFGR